MVSRLSSGYVVVKSRNSKRRALVNVGSLGRKIRLFAAKRRRAEDPELERSGFKSYDPMTTLHVWPS
jgi:hypothetical protein